MNIETMAASSVSEALSKSDYLFPNIHIGDREPSWDGDIEVYNKATPCHKKSDLIRRIPVQIKGKIVNRIREKDFKYPIQVADMRNFLQEGGAVFFVVLMEQDGENKQIYYVNLLPFDLKKLLSDYGSQKARNVELKKLPSDKEKITDIFLTCASDIKKQMSAISSKSITIDELRDLKALSIGCTCVFQHKQTPFDYLFNHGAYLYAKMPYDINLPVGHIERINSLKTSVASHVTVNKKTFYNEYNATYTKNTLEFSFGKSFQYIVDRTDLMTHKFTFRLNGTLTERIRDLEFLIAAISAKQFEIDKIVCSLQEVKPEEIASFDISEIKAKLDWLNTVKFLFDKLDVTDDLDCSRITPVDMQNIQALKSAVLDGNSIPLNQLNNSFGYFKITNLKILVYALKTYNNEKSFNILNYNEAPVNVTTNTLNGKEYPSCFVVSFKKNDFIQYSNINYNKLLQSIKAVPFSEVYSSQVVNLLLNLLLACDEEILLDKKKIETALELAIYLKDSDTHVAKERHMLNYFQVIKRLRNLNIAEEAEIMNITENNQSDEEILVGAYLLLGNQKAAEIHFNRMDTKTKAAFMKYPIFHFWNGEREAAHNGQDEI